MKPWSFLFSVVALLGCDSRPTTDACWCSGSVPGGQLEAPCGAFACVGGIGYRCADVDTPVPDAMGCAAADGGIEALSERRLTVHALAYDNAVSAPYTEGRILLHIDLELTNGANAPAASLAFPHFAIETEGGLRFLGSAATPEATIGRACPVDGIVAPGGTHRCTVVFEVPRDDTPTRVLYVDEPSAQAVLSHSPALEANRLCVITTELLLGEQECQMCVVSALFGGACRTESTAESEACLDDSCGALVNASDACADSALSYYGCATALCPELCVW